MLSLAKFIKKEIELRENLVGTGFLDPPPIKKTSQEALKDETINKALANAFMTNKAPSQSADTRFTCLGEIVQTSGFQAEKTYIFYDTFLPEGWTFEDANEYENYGSQRDEYAEFNKRKSCTHLSKATVKLVDDDSQIEGTEYVSHFSFPVDFQFLAREDKFNERPFLLLQVNSVDSWGRHRVEGYGFVRFPLDPGYHQIEVETWRPRGSLQSEIHSFFLGGSIRIMRLEELIRTKFIDEQGQSDIVNRFGLETENSGKIKVNLNICFQNAFNKKANRRKQGMQREALQLETKRQVMMYKLKVKDTLEAEKKRRLIGQRDPRRTRTNRSQRSASVDGFNLDDDSMELSADDDRFNRNLRNREVDMDGDPYGDQNQYNQQNFAFTRTAGNQMQSRF